MFHETGVFYVRILGTFIQQQVFGLVWFRVQKQQLWCRPPPRGLLALPVKKMLWQLPYALGCGCCVRGQAAGSVSHRNNLLGDLLFHVKLEWCRGRLVCLLQKCLSIYLHLQSLCAGLFPFVPQNVLIPGHGSGVLRVPCLKPWDRDEECALIGCANFWGSKSKNMTSVLPHFRAPAKAFCMLKDCLVCLGCGTEDLYGGFLVHSGGVFGTFVSDLLPDFCGIIVERDRTIVQSDLSGLLDLTFIRCCFSCILPAGGGYVGTGNITQMRTDGCGRGGGVL